MIFALALVVGAARAGCPAPVTAAELASTVQSATAACGRGDDRALRFDGPSVDRPERTATIVQRLDGEGAVVAPAYLWSGDPLPSWAIADDPPTVRGPRPLAIGATLFGTGAVALYAAAWQARGDYFAPDAPYTDEVALRHRADRLTLASAGAAVIAGGLVGAMFTVGGAF